jgi:hypothetical protein
MKNYLTEYSLERILGCLMISWIIFALCYIIYNENKLSAIKIHCAKLGVEYNDGKCWKEIK